MTARSLVSATLTLAFFIAGCDDAQNAGGNDGRTAVVPNATSARIEATRAGLADHRTVEGTSLAGGNAARWTAYFDGNQIAHIREESDQNQYGSAVNEYWFDDGVLYAWVSDATRSVAERSGPGASERIHIRVGFDAAGNVVEQTKTVDGQSVPLDSTDITSARARVEFITEHARRASAGSGSAEQEFHAPASRAGRLTVDGPQLRFIACGNPADTITVEDATGGDGREAVRQLAATDGTVTAMVRIQGDTLEDVRYAGLEGPACDRLPPEGQLEARGNEPFWFIRVSGTRAVVRTPDELDGVAYVDGAWSRNDGRRWRYDARRADTASNETLTLQLTEERCTDGMSGAWYPFRAILVREGRTMQGCALEGRQATASPPPQ